VAAPAWVTWMQPTGSDSGHSGSVTAAP